jgi:hypothetical protein
MIRQLNPATRPPVTTPYSEAQLAEEFLREGPERLFCVAVGDSGTGKSHLIRWLWQEVERKESAAWRIVRIPRHAANLADVLRHVLVEDFQGEVVERIRREIQRTSTLTVAGAMQRVMNELAFVLGTGNQELARLSIPDDEEHRDVILPLLPAMLLDASIRAHLCREAPQGIVSRLARHVMGTREERFETPGLLKWTSEDLVIPPGASTRAGADARALATQLLSDDRLRSLTAGILNVALEEAWPALVGLQRGNLQGAMLEIRRQLKVAGQELLLFIEDLSVSQGMDAELIESLIVKPSEEHGDLCVIRSIVGVTSDDFRFMRENIVGRIDLAVSFDVPLGTEDRDGVSDQHLLDLASRYLNAARYGLSSLDEWAGDANNPELGSFCEESRCPVRADCHATFGDVEGRGLYPFNRTALARLYRSVQLTETEAFRPRLLVGQVLNEFLKRAESQIPASSFPSNDLLDWFRLRSVGADVQAALLQHHGTLAHRILAATEIYSDAPWLGRLPSSLSEKLGLPISDPSPSSAGPSESKPRARTHPVPSPPGQDEFDLWLNNRQLNDSSLNHWRKAVYDAISGERDWDSDPSGPRLDRFKRAYIHFEGQHVARAGDISILVKPTPEVAIAMRGLVRGISTWEEALWAAHFVELWSADVVRQLRELSRASGPVQPLDAAVHLLTLGAMIRGDALGQGGRLALLEALVEPWPARVPPGPGAPPWSQLRDAFLSAGPALREWILHEIGAKKGGQHGTLMIDTALILEPLNAAARRVRIDYATDFGEGWDDRTYGPVFRLARRVASHVGPALNDEKEYSERWLAYIDSASSGLSTQELGDRLKQAFAASRQAAALQSPHLDQHLLGIEQLAGGHLEAVARTARALRTETGRNQQVRLIAALDRTSMEGALKTLRFSYAELARVNEFITRTLESSGQAKLAEAEDNARAGLSHLGDRLEQLMRDAPDE